VRICALGLLTLLMAAIGMAAPGFAHTRSETHSAWQISGPIVHLRFTVPDLEARRLTPDGAMPSVQALGVYIDRHVGASSGGAACVRTDGPRPVAALAGYRRYEFTFTCPDASRIRLTDSAWFELVASHTNFAEVQDEHGDFVAQLVTKDHQVIDVVAASGAGPLQNAGFLDFLQMGILHIFTGLDHMSFMLGLVLLCRRLRDLLVVVTGFTIGHSLTLGLAVTGILRPEAHYIDALVALTIAIIGAETAGDSTHRPLPVALGLAGVLGAMALAKVLGASVALPMSLLVGSALFAASYLMLSGQMRDAGRVRLVMTIMFGLVHGFGFASNLLEMRLPRARLAELLLGFNLGVEVAQVAVVLGALALAGLLVKIRWGVPRPILTDLAAAVLVGEGLFWFLARSLA
jgi:hypothetical protein